MLERVSQATFRAKGAKYLGILAVLAGVGWVGHSTHWKFNQIPLQSHEEAVHAPADDAEEVVTVNKIESPEQWAITFPSQRSLEMSGIQTATVEQKAISERIRTTGIITYDERLSASLSSRVPGTVWQVLKHVGESIQKGDVLMIIDAADVGKAKADFLTALVATESKQEILSNLELIGGGAVPLRQVREARVSLREARIQLVNAEQTLVNLGFSVNAEEYQKMEDAPRCEKIKFLGLPEEVVSQMDRTRASSNLLPIRATFDGVVLRQDVALGETAEVGKPVLEIADIRRMWLKLDVPKEEASKLALGQQITFTPDGIGKELRASVTWISTEVNEQTRTLQLRAEVENPVISSDSASKNEVRLLRANTFGTGTIVLRKTASALVVPLSAILHDNDQPLVFMRTGDLSFQRVDIQLGIRDGREVQVHATTLRPEMEVVTRGGHVLKSEWMLNHMASSSP